jgi:hypothetical protein
MIGIMKSAGRCLLNQFMIGGLVIGYDYMCLDWIGLDRPPPLRCFGIGWNLLKYEKDMKGRHCGEGRGSRGWDDMI